ncbi:hypothetical protein [Rhodohalobacter sulfatireducens]|uniref:Uncharacterized protein n=1 Tax=Rhodohalobacter sulfatireducens TaxID=2911366 RepID=A0ABS9KE08_9BACT|nr:hypothetical protein [Rhodohalobacter sulfatireducens]MCG2589065.1 hypothetical protein [Rhodohalobacter sulfatireducens]
MKKSLLGSLIGISIILSLESLSRVIISLYENEDILMFSYSLYSGFWPMLLVVIAAFSTFFGAMFALTYGREKQVFSLILFVIFAGLYRYGQITLLDDTEGLLYPVVVLVLSLLSIFLAWKLVRPSKAKKDQDSSGTPPTPQKHHHHPVDGDQQHSQPQ